MKEFFVIYDGSSVDRFRSGILWLCDIEQIFFRCYGVMPSEFRSDLEHLQPGQTLSYTFPGTADTIKVCNASDLLYEQ